MFYSSFKAFRNDITALIEKGKQFHPAFEPGLKAAQRRLASISFKKLNFGKLFLLPVAFFTVNGYLYVNERSVTYGWPGPNRKIRNG
ncbi:hypothetical protein FACS1894110_06460 [Spirochaetia bacterium]|nr:hypothetical protein FACS1894110_06460 [Spirochaetia bacterium]